MTKRRGRKKWVNLLAKSLQQVEGCNMVLEDGERSIEALNLIDKGLRQSIDKLHTPEMADALDLLLACAERCTMLELEIAYDVSAATMGDAAIQGANPPSLFEMDSVGRA